MLNTRVFGRYKELVTLLVKYGRSDIVQQSELQEYLDEDAVESSGEPTPSELASDLEARGATYIKLGQLLSTRSDIMPAAYREALAKLQDDVETIPYEDVESIVSDSLGVRISKAFESFDEKPLASASLGQVHAAKLRDGRDVVVKVQRPGIREVIVQDLEVFRNVARAVEKMTSVGRRLQFVRIVESLERTLTQELDYRHEAANSRQLRTNLADNALVTFPEVIDDYSTGRVLTTERLTGTKITDVSPVVLVERNRSALARAIFDCWLCQVLEDGLFHADPHPGNLFLLDDGRIGLLDAGMVIPVPPQLRQRLGHLLLAISEARGEQVAEIAILMNTSDGEVDHNQFQASISRLVIEHHQRPIERMNAGELIYGIQATAGECGIHLPHEVLMLGKTLMHLDEVVAALDPEFNPTEAIRESATEIIGNHAEQNLTPSAFFQTLLQTTDLLQQLPGRVNRLTERIANNDLELKVKTIDEQKLLTGFEKVANRITTGLILAAMIVGASFMMRLETSWKVFGYPGIAMLFFLFSAICGGWMVVKSLFVDHS